MEVVGGGGEGASDLVNVNACRLEGGEESKGKCEINHGMQLLLTELDIFREGNVGERDVV